MIRINLWKEFYYNGKQSLLDLLNYQIFKTKNLEEKLLAEIEFFKDKECPSMPIKADFLMKEYNINEGKVLGLKLKKIEEKWISNNFKISDEEVKKLILS